MVKKLKLIKNYEQPGYSPQNKQLPMLKAHFSKIVLKTRMF